MLTKVRYKIISLLSFGEPLILNFMVNGAMVKDGKPAVYMPAKDKKFTEKEAGEMAVLVPMRNIYT